MFAQKPGSDPVQSTEEKKPPRSAEPPTIEANDLLKGSHEVRIRHGDEIYLLRQTRNGKLILHK